jgi:hypothetical protein
MNSSPGLVVLYRWKLRPSSEQAFVRAWSVITESLLRQGSLGSRLHLGSDNIWYGYAQWPSRAARDQAFATDSTAEETEAMAAMQAAIAERLPEIELTPQADFLAPLLQKTS